MKIGRNGVKNLNYLIWNGTDSRNFNGLMICELPAITKPAMRFENYEFAGADGDFCENLGYSAYDKDVKIGLFGNFDVDLIAKFFSNTGQTGQVIFSNEPTKYYNATILGQIDFERLATFRTATVKFHTQPFKYLVNESPIISSVDGNFSEIKVTNQGLENSKPIFTIWGVGTVIISVNGTKIFQLEFAEDDKFLTVNSAIQECYRNSVNVLKNRQMGGNFPELLPGENTISWEGTVTKIQIEPKSRWL